MVGSLILATALAIQSPAPQKPAVSPTTASPRVAGATAKAKPATPERAATDAPKASVESDRSRLITKRQSKRSARVRAVMAREAAEAEVQAKALAEAKKEAKEMLPYQLEDQRQMFNRESRLEANMIQAQRNDILDRFLNGGGVVVGQPAPPPRIVNMPGMPLANS